MTCQNTDWTRRIDCICFTICVQIYRCIAKRGQMVQFLEKEHKNFEKILYKSMAFENCANFLKATNMLIGRNPKNDFRVKHPFINQEFHVMISELDKCAERKQSFSFFNVKELGLQSWASRQVPRYLVSTELWYYNPLERWHKNSQQCIKIFSIWKRLEDESKKGSNGNFSHRIDFRYNFQKMCNC